MDIHTEITELQEVYQGMDAEGRKKMSQAAVQLLKVQKSLEDTENENGEVLRNVGTNEQSN
jgi:hypothetical protein